MRKGIIFISLLIASILFFGNVNVMAAQGSISTLRGFINQFCKVQKVKRLKERIFLVSADIFEKNKLSFNCPHMSNFIMQKMKSEDDPGHFIYYVESPKGSKNTYDCDAKADIGMKVIGLNCYPTSKEVPTHKIPNRNRMRVPRDLMQTPNYDDHKEPNWDRY